MTTELVWSTVKPTFEEVVGKQLRIIRSNILEQINSYNTLIFNEYSYNLAFGEDFICYADLTAPVSPLPLWGVEPEVIHAADEGYFVKYGTNTMGSCDISTRCYPTRELAILAWNRIAEALNEVEK